MTVKLGVVMDPIEAINYKKDTSLAMLLAAKKRGWDLYYYEMNDLFVDQGRAMGRRRPLHVHADPEHWFDLGDEEITPLADLDVMLMRKDPPFDMEFVYATYILERAEDEGCLVVNRPQSLRDANEKMFTSWFGQCCPPTLVTRSYERLFEFLDLHGDIILKPLDGMGGASIFRVQADAPNMHVIFETLTAHQTQFAMAQKFIPEIRAGDKRILMINGEPLPFALARVPAEDDIRGNLAAGAKGVGVELGERERWICAQVGPKLREKGLIFVGLDVIGDYLTEINVTSPTCIRELDEIYGTDIATQFLDAVAAKLPG